MQRRILQRYTVNVDATYARSTSLYGVTDLNLNTAAPQFTLSSEGNRPVYVTPGAIVPTTGALQSLNSRVQSAYGDVYSVNSNLGSEAKQVTASINGFTPQGINMSLSYTYQRSRDQISSTGGSAGALFRSPTTDGDPNLTLGDGRQRTPSHPAGNSNMAGAPVGRTHGGTQLLSVTHTPRSSEATSTGTAHSTIARSFSIRRTPATRPLPTGLAA